MSFYNVKFKVIPRPFYMYHSIIADSEEQARKLAENWSVNKVEEFWIEYLLSILDDEDGPPSGLLIRGFEVLEVEKRSE